MTPLDWIVMVATIVAIPSFGLWRGRGSKTVNQYLLAGKTMPWYAMGLSIMATQASAITFIATTGQAYVDGMRFVQFYFGLPIALVILSATAVPIFHRSGVYTAYEYLEKRFDAKTRALAAIVFLIQRGMAVGIAFYAPAIVMSVIFGWPDRITTLIIGIVCVIYTTKGGIPAVTWTDVLQMSIIFFGLILGLITVVSLMPRGVSFADAVYLAGAVGKLNAVDLRFDPNNRYNLWSGLVGGAFLALGYFGCDQSQVQRYLTGKSIAQSRLGLLFNATAKVPMQFFILFVGAMVFVFYLFVQPPILFDRNAAAAISKQGAYAGIEAKYEAAWKERQAAAVSLNAARKNDDLAKLATATGRYRTAQRAIDSARASGVSLYESSQHQKAYNDTNYIFLSFVTRYFPAGVVGLVIAVIFTAAMSSSSGELNSLAAVSVMDLYRRHFRRQAPDGHYLLVSRIFTAAWGVWAVLFAQYARGLGSLVEAVNQVGSFFYPVLLGAFVLAFFFRRVQGGAAFWAMLMGEAAIVACALFTKVAFLWYNVIGAAVVIVCGLLLSLFRSSKRPSLSPELRSAVRRSFDEASRDEEHFPATIDPRIQHVQALLKFFGPLADKRVLDAGCGKGRFDRVLLERNPGAQICGLDISEAMLACVSPGIGRVAGYMTELPFADSAFDCVFATESLEHAVEIDKAVAELCRVLKPGGRLAIIDKNVEHWGRFKTPEWERWFKRRELEKLIGRYCGTVRSEFLSYWEDVPPDGLFLVWYAEK